MTPDDYDHGGAMLDAEAQAAFEATEPDPPDWLLDREPLRTPDPDGEAPF